MQTLQLHLVKMYKLLEKKKEIPFYIFQKADSWDIIFYSDNKQLGLTRKLG